MTDTQNASPDRATLAQFWRKLAHLQSSGVPLVEGLSAIATDMAATVLAPLIATIKSEIENGWTISRSLTEHPEVFSAMTVALVRTGEIAGEVDKAVMRVADGLEAGTIDVGQKKPEQEIDPHLKAEADEVQEAFERTVQILNEGVKSHASDIHIEPYKDDARVRYRIDGVMHEAQRLSPQECRRLAAWRVPAMRTGSHSPLPRAGYTASPAAPARSRTAR